MKTTYDSWLTPFCNHKGFSSSHFGKLDLIWLQSLKHAKSDVKIYVHKRKENASFIYFIELSFSELSFRPWLKVPSSMLIWSGFVFWLKASFVRSMILFFNFSNSQEVSKYYFWRCVAFHTVLYCLLLWWKNSWNR